MHDGWHILRWGWSAVVVFYGALSIVASRRLRGRERKRSAKILAVIVTLIATRFFVRFAFGGGQTYRLAVVCVGVAAGIAALDLARMLIAHKEDAGTVDGDGAQEQIQSLKLS